MTPTCRNSCTGTDSSFPPRSTASEEEGTPMVPAHGRRRYQFVPRPAGTRWYHTHTMAGIDLHRGTYTGQFGFVFVEPAENPGQYDQEVFLALRDWEPYLTLGRYGRNGDGATGTAARKARQSPTSGKTVWKSAIGSSRSTTSRSVRESRFESGRASACWCTCSTPAPQETAALPLRVTCSTFWLWMETRCRLRIRSKSWRWVRASAWTRWWR